jgi:hypothetical protein
MRKAIGLVAILAIAAGAIGGAAASLGNVADASFGATTQTVASCQGTSTGPITVTWGNPGYMQNLGGYGVASVQIGNIDAACQGKAIKLTVFGADKAPLTGGQTASHPLAQTEVVGGTPGYYEVTFTSGLPADAVAGVAVLVK